jgi:hypothetical protein
MAKAKQHRRKCYISVPGRLELQRSAVKIWGYDKTGKFVCRLEINGAGLAAFAGEKGGKKLGDMTWEKLVKALE